MKLKCFVIVIMLLFVGTSIMPTSAHDIKKFLAPLKEDYSKIHGAKEHAMRVVWAEDSVLCGFVTDSETNEPIEYAEVCFFVEDEHGYQFEYSGYSNSSGFYYIESVCAGYCFEYGAWANGYHFNWGWSGPFAIPENMMVWVNFSMNPFQPETAVVCGFVYDNFSSEPIINMTVYMIWFDIHDEVNYNGSTTDEYGFYAMNVGAGEFAVNTDSEAYINQGFGWIPIQDFETAWVNFSLDPELIIEISKPVNGIYLRNIFLIPFLVPVVVGTVDIIVNVTVQGGNPIEYVELFIDDCSRMNFTAPPYVFIWNTRTWFQLHHSIEIVVHRRYDSDAAKNLLVWKFF